MIFVPEEQQQQPTGKRQRDSTASGTVRKAAKRVRSEEQMLSDIVRDVNSVLCNLQSGDVWTRF